MKIYYVVNTFPTNAETFVYTEIRELINNGIDISIYPLRSDKNGQNGLDLENRCIYKIYKQTQWLYLIRYLFCHPIKGVTIVSKFLKNSNFKVRKFFSKLSSLGHAVKLNDIIRKEEKRKVLVHCHFAGRTAEVGLYLERLFNIEYSVTVHAADIYAPDNRKDLIERLNNAKSIRTISEFGKQFLLQNALVKWESEIKVIPCGIELPDKGLANHSTRQNANTVVLAVGRLVEKKGFKYLLEAMPKVISSFPNVLLVILGNGPLMSELVALTKSLNITQFVKFVGSVSNEQVHEWLEIASVFVLPCVKDSRGDMDGIPVSLMEAMSSCVPVISTEISGIPELIISGTSGLLVRPNNHQELASAILSILSDKNLAYALSINGKKQVEKSFNVETQARELITFFRGL